MRSWIAVLALGVLVVAGAGCFNSEDVIAPNEFAKHPTATLIDFDEEKDVVIIDWKSGKTTPEQLEMERRIVEHLNFQAEGMNLWLEDAHTGLRTTAEVCAVSEGWVNDTLRVNLGVEGTNILARAVGADSHYGGITWTGSDIVHLAGEGWKTSQPWASWSFFGANSAEPDSNVFRFGGAHWAPLGEEPVQLDGSRSIFGVVTFTAASGTDWMENVRNFDDLDAIDPGCYTNIGVGQGYE